MKIRRHLTAYALLIAGGVLLETGHADENSRRAQYNYNRPRPAPPANQGPGSAPPVDKPVKFKDLPLNAEFYFLADKDRKLFPRIKISSTAAKSVPTAASPIVSTNAVPVETLVIMKKEVPKKVEPKNEGEKKKPDDKKEGKQAQANTRSRA